MLLVFSGLALAGSVRVVVYPSFAEVSQEVEVKNGVLVWSPGEDVLAGLVDGGVRLVGIPEVRRVWRGGSVVFHVANDGTARLSYLTRSLGGSLSYHLDLDAGELVAWVRVQNSLTRPLVADEFWYVAGSVPLGEGGVRPASAALWQKGQRAVEALAPEAEFVSATAGVFRYRYPERAELEPGITELAFKRGLVRPRLTWSYRGAFVRDRRLFFTRGYLFKAPWPVAAGSISLWSEGTFVGRVPVADTDEGDEVRLSLGPDPRGFAERRVEVLEENRDLARYRVSTAIKNRHREPVRVEIQETFSGREVVLKITGAERIPQGYRLKVDLAPGGEWTYVYEVTIRRR